MGAPHAFPFAGEPWVANELAEFQPRNPRGSWFDLVGGDSPGPERGEVLRVLEVSIAIEPDDKVRIFALRFSRWPDRAFDSREFRKIEPRADRATPAADAFIAQMRHVARPAHAGAR